MVFDPISIAIQIALVVASIILTAKNIEVGKLDDISVDTGSYNRIIPRVYGSQIVVPQTIWIANNKLIEVKKKKSILFGLGGSVTTYKYFATFAVAATNNKVQLRRVWANDTLVFDLANAENGGISEEILEAVTGAFGRGGLFGLVARRLNLRLGIFDWDFKDGSNSQSKSLILTKVDGDAETTAYRGISYLAIQTFPLEDFGNSIPQFKFELVEADNADHITNPLPISSGISGLPSLDSYGRVLKNGGSAIDIIDPMTASIENTIDTTGLNFGFIFYSSVHYYQPSNAIVGVYGIDVEASMIDVTTGRIIGTAQPSSHFVNSSTAVHGDYFWMIDTDGRISYFNIRDMQKAGGAPNLGSFSITALTGHTELAFPLIAPTSNSTRFGATYTTNVGPEAGPKLYLHGLPTFALDELYGFGSRPSIGYSFSEDAFILCGDAGIVKLDKFGNLMAHNPRECGGNTMALRSITEHNINSVWLAASPGFIKVDIETLEITKEISGADLPGVGGGHDVLTLPAGNAIVVDSGNPRGSDWSIIYIDRVDQADTTVRRIVEDLAEQIGFPAERLDASAGTRTVGGMIIAGDDARRSIDELLKITGYDLIEEDGKVKIIDRGNAPVMAIDADDLGTNENDGASYRLERTLTREADAPWKVELGFADIDGDFESNLAIARRAIDAVHTQTVLAVDTPIALDVDTAKTFAAKMLSQAHRERAGVSLTLPMVKYGQLSPGDVISVPDGADTLNVKIIRASGANVLSLRGVIDDPTGIDTLLIGSPRSVPSATLTRVGKAGIIVVDSALPNDSVSNADGYGVNSFSIPSNRNIGPVEFIRSIDDGVTFEQLSANEGDPIVGSATGTLVDIASPGIIDNASSLTMTFIEPPIEVSAEQLWLDNDLNVIFVQVGDDWEIMQFANVLDNLNGTHTISGFMRGLRGTEHLIGQHAEPYLVVVKNNAYTRGGDLTHYQTDTKYAAILSDEDNPYLIDYAPKLRGLRPYSPVHLNIEKPESDNIISWTRRTRIGGADLDGSDVALSEASENYEIDILDGNLNLVATKTGIISESFTYTVADQITDLGAEHTEFTARIFQISEEVGRGISSEIYTQNLNPSRMVTISKLSPSILAMNEGGVTISKISVSALAMNTGGVTISKISTSALAMNTGGVTISQIKVWALAE